MSWFRSEPMQYVSLIVQEDAAAAVVDALGRMGVMQFTDMNPSQTAFQRRYSNEVKRCDELERKLRFLESELSKARIRSEENADVERFLAPPSSFVSPLVLQQQQPRSSPLPAAAAAASGSFGGARTLDTLTAIFEQRESDVKEMGSYFKNLTREYNAQVEARYVLQLGSTFFQSAVRNPDLDAALSGDAAPGSSAAASAAAASIRFSCIAGTISAEEKLNFERTAFRATRGNCLVRFVDIDGAIVDPQSGQDVVKSVFVVLFRSRTVEEKLVRVCNAFGARRYDVPNLDDPAAVTRRVAEISAEVDAKQQLLLQHRAHMTRMLGDIASRMQEWKWTVRRE